MDSCAMGDHDEVFSRSFIWAMLPVKAVRGHRSTKSFERCSAKAWAIGIIGHVSENIKRTVELNLIP